MRAVIATLFTIAAGAPMVDKIAPRFAANHPVSSSLQLHNNV
jgi:hypothetical protein